MSPTLQAEKPMGAKAYGHIAHLPGSRMGPGDHQCHEGQARIATVKTRDRHDRVIVQEKLDGSCVAVFMGPERELFALGRAGWLAQSSPYEQHQLFAYWVRENAARFDAVLHPGERLVGEWLAQAHGTRYDLTNREPFVAFDIMTGTTRVNADTFYSRTLDVFETPAVLNDQASPMSIEAALTAVLPHGLYGALDEVEGAVWRVERDGVVDFLAKYVRPDKVDGKYLPDTTVSINPGVEVWNWRP